MGRPQQCNPCCGATEGVSSSSRLVQVCASDCNISPIDISFQFTVSGISGVFAGLISCTGFNRSWNLVWLGGCRWAQTFTTPLVGSWSSSISFPEGSEPGGAAGDTSAFMLRFQITPFGESTSNVARYGPRTIPCATGVVTFDLLETFGCSGWPSSIDVTVST